MLLSFPRNLSAPELVFLCSVRRARLTAEVMALNILCFAKSDKWRDVYSDALKTRGLGKKWVSVCVAGCRGRAVGLVVGQSQYAIRKSPVFTPDPIGALQMRKGQK